MLSLSNYVDLHKSLAKIPDKVDYAQKAMEAIKQTYGNTQQGDCVIAGKLHQIGIWTGNESGKPAVSSDQEALAQYHKICGGGDQGCVITDVLDYFQRSGLSCGGNRHTIDGYVAVDWTNEDLVKLAIAIFGSLTIGINLPEQWTCTDCVWDEHATGNVGGHDVCCVGYDDRGVQICTWGGVVTITWAAFTSRRWIEECFCALSPDWYNNNQLAPSGVDAVALKEDLDKLRQGDLPPLPEPTPPVPPVPPGPGPGPAAPPTYQVSVTGQVPGHLFGHEFVTLSGAAVPMSQSYNPALNTSLPPINWPQIIQDILKIIEDFISGKAGGKRG